MRQIILTALTFFVSSGVHAETVNDPAPKQQPMQVAAPARPVPPSFADIVQNLSPAVVNISTTQKVKRQVGGLQFQLPQGEQFDQLRDFFEQFGGAQGGGKTIEQEVYSLGSGFILDAEGHVVTNNHVIGEADKVKVILSDNTKLDAKIIGRDSKTDLALLKVESKKPLPFVKFGNSDAARVGDWVLAIGNPFGLGGTVTSGIISARARNINSGPFDDYIQTDAAINRGNSGGPLFNLNGEVIGVNSAIFSPTGGNIGIGFSVPANMAKPVIDQLKSKGSVARGWLGVKIQEVNEEIQNSLGLPQESGALVLEVTKSAPAERSGLKPGDVITAFDGKEITQTHNLPRIVADTPIGKKVRVTVWRGGKRQEIGVTVGELKDEDARPQKRAGVTSKQEKESATSVIGMGVTDLNAAMRAQLSLPATQNGVAVVELLEEGEAAKRGVRYGDVIAQVNGVPIRDANALVAAIKNAKALKRNFVLLGLIREGEEFFVTLPIE